jgi:hypothetical protein
MQNIRTLDEVKKIQAVLTSPRTFMKKFEMGSASSG